jgi:hypothetical protein
VQKDESSQKDRSSKPELRITGAAACHVAFAPSPKYTYHRTSTDEKSAILKSDKHTSTTRISGGETNIAFLAKGALDNGVRYSATIDFDAMKGATGVDKMYIGAEHDKFGTFHIGNVKGPEATFLCSGQDLIGGTLGVNGTVASDIDYATGVIMPLYMIGYTNKATKIVWYSPRVVGFQLGVGWTPDTKHVGNSLRSRRSGDSSIGYEPGIYVKGTSDERPSGKNSISIGLNHKWEFSNGFRTQVAAVYLMEESRAVRLGVDGSNESTDKKISLHNTRAYHLTATVGYQNWAVGVGYLNSGKSRLPKNYNDFYGAATNVTDPKSVQAPVHFLSLPGANAGSAWNVGVQYKYHDWTFATVFHQTQRRVTKDQKTKGNMLTFSTDYKVCDGLVLFAEFDNIRSKSCAAACDMRNRSEEKVKADGTGAGKTGGLAVETEFDDATGTAADQANAANAAAAAAVKNVAIGKQTCQLFVVGVKVSF